MAQAVASLEQQADKTALITGSEAIAVACKLADVDVITAYPIRPYDTVMQYVAKLVANGELDCEYIVAESEHSQFEIVKHASAVGARVFCGSSGDVFAIQLPVGHQLGHVLHHRIVGTNRVGRDHVHVGQLAGHRNGFASGDQGCLVSLLLETCYRLRHDNSPP